MIMGGVSRGSCGVPSKRLADKEIDASTAPANLLQVADNHCFKTFPELVSI
jgi:hypothetical protein